MRKQENMERKEFNYYAFISYSRADEKWAKWIQRRLETYRFPTALRKENRNLPGKIFPICRDKTDLPGGVLWEQLKSQLDESEYLIVICSPSSAKSEWVSREISYFQELGRNRNIIPFIVDGEPHAADDTVECYNPALLNHPDEELLGVSVRELGRNKAVLRVIASLMQLRYDQLVMRDKRRTNRRRAVAAGLAAVVLAVTAGLVWYEIPHSAYYWGYVYQNELPVGLEEVSAKDRKTAHDYYRIVTRRNKVIRLERINSAGTVTGGATTFAIDELPVIEFYYSEEGGLSSVTQKDVYGDVQLVKNYTPSLNAVDFRNPHDDTAVVTLPSDLSANMGMDSLMVFSSNNSEIARELLEYDENGYLIQMLYMRDNRNTPVCDENGIYGKRYVRDEDGKILRVINLGEDGEALRMQYGTSVVFTDYEYDDRGRILRCRVYDAEEKPTLDERNVFCWENIYNEVGCVAQIRCLDADGNLVPNLDGISQYELEYDGHGFLEAHRGLDGEGNAAYDKENGVFRVVYQNDKNGRNIGLDCYDAEGHPMADKGGLAGYRYQYDRQGRIVEAWFYGVDGELTCWADSLNEAGHTIEYRDEENVIIWTYYGKDGNIALNKDGYAIQKKTSNTQGLTVEDAYYDADGNPVRTRRNTALVVYAYDNAEHLISTSFYDENGLPCCSAEGVAVIKRAYDGDGNQISEKYYDTEGLACYVRNEGGNYASWQAEYNDRGQISAMRHYGKEGGLLSFNGAYEERNEYDERGNCIHYAAYDHKGNLINNSDGYATTEATYNERGQMVSQSYRDKNGSFVTGQDYAYEMEYDARGNLICQAAYTLDEEGKETCLVTHDEYDGRDKLMREYYEDETGRLCADEDGIAVYELTRDERDMHCASHCYNDSGELIKVLEFDHDERGNISERRSYTISTKGGEQIPVLSGRTTYTYDDYGNQAQVWRYDSDGKVIADEDGVACVAKTYDVMGRCVREECRDRDNGLITYPGGYAVEEIDYDTAGREICHSYYDADGALVPRESGHIAVMTKKWNEFGDLEEQAAYDEAGNYFWPGGDGVSRIVYAYDLSGVNTAKWFYDEQGQPSGSTTMLLCVDGLTNRGDEAGLGKYDIIMEYDGWSFADEEYFTATDYSELKSRFATSADRSRVVKVCKAEKFYLDDEYEFMECILEAGVMGFEVREAWLDIESVKLLQERFKTWEPDKMSNKIP